MLNLNLQLQPTNQPCSTPTAWFLPGHRTQRWLNEISSWKVEHSQIKLIVIPRSRSDRNPIGLLAFGDSIDAEAGIERSAFAIPYRLLANRLYLPMEAQLNPLLTAAELSERLLTDNYYVWHPICGLVVASNSEILRVSDLLNTPASQREQNWDFAHPGITFIDRLHSLEGPKLGSVDEIMDESRGDIGDQAKDPDHWKKLLAESDQVSDAPQSVNKLTYGFAKAIRWIASNAPANASQRTWLNDLGDWASSKIEAASRHLHEQRHKELFRLQRLLANDPDKGLKYALPLAGDMSHRGTGASSGYLNQRNVDFRLGGLGGGGAADHWDVPYEIRQKLLEQYRQLAQREIRLGRHRRAAYIFAELLGDLNAAAKALESGKHFREAAVIYREKLNRSSEAARCLEEGGLWQEAIEQYRELAQFEKVGDLYRRLNLDEEAEGAYQEAIKELATKNDYLNTARIEEIKLEDPQRALLTLEKAWPDTSQAVSCLEQSFRIFACLGDHERAQVWLRRVDEEASGLKSMPQSVQLISGLATTYPDRATQNVAIATTQRIVSNAIENGSLSASDGLLNCVTKLFPDDKLLTRDCRRYSIERSQQRLVRKPVPRLEHVVDIKRLRSISLADGASWTKLVHVGKAVVACGHKGDEFWAVRISWACEGLDDSIFLNRVVYKLPATWNAPKVIVKFVDDSIGLALHPIADNSFPVKTFEPYDSVPTQLAVGNVTSLSDDVLGTALWGHDRFANVRLVNGEYVLDIVTSSGDSLDSHRIDSMPGDDVVTLPIPVVCDGTHLYLSIGQHLRIYGRGGWIETLDLEEVVSRVTASARSTAPRIAIAFERGVQILWGGVTPELTQKFCTGLERPRILFTRTGHLVVASQDKCEVYKTSQRKITFVASFSIESCEDVVATNDSQQFAILSSDGKVTVYQIPLR